MCCFVLCYFANTKIDESFRTAKIRRTFFGNSLASKFAGCVRKDDFGSGRLRKNRRRKGKTAQFRRTKGRDDPFIIRKIQSHMQFGFGTNAFFPIFGVVTTLLSVGRFCKAICNSVLEQTYFLLSLPCNPQQRVVLAGEKIWKILFETVKRYPALRCSLRRMARDMIPTSLRRGLYALTATKVFQSRPLGKQTVVRVRIFTGAAQRSPKSTPP